MPPNLPLCSPTFSFATRPNNHVRSFWLSCLVRIAHSSRKPPAKPVRNVSQPYAEIAQADELTAASAPHRIHYCAVIRMRIEACIDSKPVRPLGSGGCLDLPKQIVQIAIHRRDLIPDISKHRGAFG